MLKYFGLKPLLLEIYKLEIDLAVKYKKIELIEKAVQNLYEFVGSFNFKGFYLLPSTEKQTYITLAAFVSSNP